MQAITNVVQMQLFSWSYLLEIAMKGSRSAIMKAREYLDHVIDQPLSEENRYFP